MNELLKIMENVGLVLFKELLYKKWQFENEKNRKYKLILKKLKIKIYR